MQLTGQKKIKCQSRSGNLLSSVGLSNISMTLNFCLLAGSSV